MVTNHVPSWLQEKHGKNSSKVEVTMPYLGILGTWAKLMWPIRSDLSEFFTKDHRDFTGK